MKFIRVIKANNISYDIGDGYEIPEEVYRDEVKKAITIGLGKYFDDCPILYKYMSFEDEVNNLVENTTFEYIPDTTVEPFEFKALSGSDCFYYIDGEAVNKFLEKSYKYWSAPDTLSRYLDDALGNVTPAHVLAREKLKSYR